MRMTLYIALQALLAAASSVKEDAGRLLRDFPKCAVPCIKKAVREQTTCKVDDAACFCQAFDGVVKNPKTWECLDETCYTDYYNKTVFAAVAVCVSVVDSKPPGASRPLDYAEKFATAMRESDEETHEEGHEEEHEEEKHEENGEDEENEEHGESEHEE